MKIFSVTSLVIATLFFSSNLLAERPAKFLLDFNINYSQYSSLAIRNDDPADESEEPLSNPDDCRPQDPSDHSLPPELSLSTTPFIYDSPILAVNAYRPIKLIAKKFLKKRYEIVDHYAQAYSYLVAPIGDYPWGEYIIKLKGPSALNSLETSYVTITVFINYVDYEDGYRATGFDLQQQTVY